MPQVFVCPFDCGKGPWTMNAHLVNHMRAKHRDAPRVEAPVEEPTFEPEVGVVAPAPVAGKPAILPEWRQNPAPYFGLRSKKMLRPVCGICQGGPNVALGWWFTCTHDPYISHFEVLKAEPIYGTLPDGRRYVEKMAQVAMVQTLPNVIQVPITPKVNGGKGEAIARGRGCISPSELRSPEFPFGIADACEYHECFEQKHLEDYGGGKTWEENEDFPYVGRFCRRVEAALVKRSDKTTEIGYDQGSRAIRRRQLAEVQF